MLESTSGMSTLLAQLNLGDAYKLNLEDGRSVRDVFSTPADLINLLLPNLFIIGGVLLFFFTIGAGFQMVMHPDDKKAKEEGSKKLGYAIGGFILLFISYWLMQIIDRSLGLNLL